LYSQPICSHGAYERIGRCPEVHQQRGEAWQAPGAAASLLQGDHQVPHRDDEVDVV